MIFAYWCFNVIQFDPLLFLIYVNKDNEINLCRFCVGFMCVTPKTLVKPRVFKLWWDSMKILKSTVESLVRAFFPFNSLFFITTDNTTI